MLEAIIIRTCTPVEIEELPTKFLVRVANALIHRMVLGHSPAKQQDLWDEYARDLGKLRRYLTQEDNNLAARSTALRWINA